MRKVLLRDNNTKNAEQNTEYENRISIGNGYDNNDNHNGNNYYGNNGRNDANNNNNNHGNNVHNVNKSHKNINDNFVSSDPYKLSSPRNREFHSILETVKYSVQKEAPKLIFSVCQALGSVGFVFLIEYARCEKLNAMNCVLETDFLVNNNNNNNGDNNNNNINNGNNNRNNDNNKDMKNGDKHRDNIYKNLRINTSDNLPVLNLMQNNQIRCQCCVSKITSILIAMLRHGAVKVREE
jgi:hypothetical protein